MRQILFTVLAFLIFCAPVWAEDTIKSLDDELWKLEKQLPDILKEETDLDARQDYVNRILELREKIEALEGEEDGAAGDGRHIFKLVRIESSEPLEENTMGDISWRRTFSESNTTLTFIRDGTQEKIHPKTLDSSSLGFDSYPQEIILGESFSFKGSAVTQRDISPGPCKHGKQSLPLTMSMSLSGGSGLLTNQAKKITPYEVSDCKGKSTQNVGVGARVELLAECTADGGDFDYGAVRYHYKCEISATDGKGAWGRKKEKMLFELDVETDGNSKPVLDEEGLYILDPPTEHSSPVQENFHVSLRMNNTSTSYPVQLVYEPVYSTEEKLEATDTVQHVPINNSVEESEEPQNEKTEDLAGKVDSNEEGKSETSEQETTAQVAAREKDARRPHIEDWLRNADPIENLDDGYNLKYDEWGRVSGKAPNGTITLSGKPDDAGADSIDYVWGRAGDLNSINLCTLKEYVARKLENKDTSDCRMHIPTPVPDTPSAKSTVPDFVGQEAAKAKADLEKLGVKVKWQAGSIAKDTAQQSLVEKQKPAPGTDLKKVKQVELWVYRYAATSVLVPDVVGLSYSKASNELGVEGLKAKLGTSNHKPKRKKDAGTIKSQEPKAGEKISFGGSVILHKYEGGEAAKMPDVIGMPFPKAAAHLNSEGLNAVRKLERNAPTKEQEGNVVSTSHAAGSSVPIGTDVTLEVYAVYREGASDQLQVKNDPADAFGDGSSGADSGAFKCDVGLGLTLEKSGRKYPDRKNGVLKTDALGEKNYICRYNVDGKQRIALVSYFDKPPATAEGQKLKQHMCSVFGLSKWGKAVYINLENTSLPKAVGKENVQRFYDFHFSQIARQAISCSGGGSSETNATPSQNSGNVPSRMKCDAGIPGIQSGQAYNDTEKSSKHKGKFDYHCSYGTSKGKTSVTTSFFVSKPADPAKGESYGFNGHCSMSAHNYPKYFKGVGMSGKAVYVRFDHYTIERLGESAANRLIQFHLNQVLPYATSCR